VAAKRVESLMLTLGHRVAQTTAEGPHLRYALWTSGCTLRCPGCCNPDLFDPRAGKATSLVDILADIDESRQKNRIEGVSILGGEPLQQLAALTPLCEAIATRGLGILVFTGYTFEEAQTIFGTAFDALWQTIDTLIDGRYVATQRELPSSASGRRFIGSQNQRILHRTARYEDPRLWQGSARIEVQIDTNGRVQAHGDPRVLNSWLSEMQRNGA
jgi:anaerobic ribonucleoside-triphosphate reductase activating protein